MQPISILGPDASDLADALIPRLDGRVAVVRAGDDPVADGGTGVNTEPTVVTDDRPETAVSLSSDGSWRGRGTVDGLDDLLDGLAPDHDYLVAVGHDRLRLPTVLLGPDADPADTPGDVVATGTAADDVDLDALVDALDAAEPWVTRETLVDRVEASPRAERSGAIATFTGRVRARDGPDDDRTTHLAFEKYEGVARERMDAISNELTDREGVFEVEMYHRTGVIEAGEDIVFVVVLAGHRVEAFRAVEDGIDRLKDEVPIFKKETTESEEFWLHRPNE
ncbi:molybdopterin synthase catalytic subunit [Halorubrum alkaliphilum]|uniref:Molybdopterin synthase catalytic subunit n=1 Tax=Halorubrum alkaliphilum TaxID=261290 RepID=A0A8T4GFN1_9EURY|nr:molybdopterin synthase [Halorubrum alkaliphilum]MBP1922261.1 molybdopterin synthase catalytic subunit [Halorubrum alkaliphilum]